MDAQVLTATIGYVRFNTVDPPRPDITLRFGTYNPRAVNTKVVKKLVSDFNTSGRQPAKEALCALADPSWIELDSLADNPATPWEKLKDVRFTAAVSGQTIDILTGQHRSVAGREWREEMLKEKGVQEKARDKATDKQQAEHIKKADEHIGALSAAVKMSTVWLTQFLDPSKLLLLR